MTAPLPGEEQPTAVQPAVTTTTVDDDLWPVHARSGGLRLRTPTAVLLALLVAAVAAWGGALLEKHHGASSAAASPASAFRSFAAARSRTGSSTGSSTGGYGGFGFGGRTGSTGSGATAGTVTFVQGNTLWVTNASGSLVKVKLSGSTTITRNASTTKSGLKPGDTVVVQGSTAKGVVSASSVAATAKGVTSTGFGGFGGTAGTSAAPSTGATG